MARWRPVSFMLLLHPAHNGTPPPALNVGNESIRKPLISKCGYFLAAREACEQARHRQVCSAEAVSNEIRPAVGQLAVKPVESGL